MRTIWILGDQLHEDHPAFARADRKRDRVLFVESRRRSAQVNYHQLKLVLIFSAMRHRAKALREAGWQVDYIELTGNFTEGLEAHVAQWKPDAVWLQEPSQYAFRQAIPKLARKIGVPIDLLPSNQFLVPEGEFQAWAGDSQHLLMENHYRRVRKKLNLLIDRDGKPVGNAWNFDAKNRETYTAFARRAGAMPPAPRSSPDGMTRDVISLVRQEFDGRPGDARKFWLPVTREESLAWLRDFVQHRLKSFGPWEDVMVADAPVLFHSVLTPMLNIGLLTPGECVKTAIEAYEEGDIPLASVEGFVRQIVGWREFINGVYWHRMPGYEDLNELGAERPLPAWIYTGETEMNCLRHVLGQVIDTGYNHHIQRLMILGNFFLLGGFAPSAVLRWYLEMYVDAHDWVMAANVIGMVLHADGGYMATKPYAASAAYINKMSNYCKGCRYKFDQRTGPDACPFNYLYWHFYGANEERFSHNHRVSMMIQTWRNKPAAEKSEIMSQSEAFLAQ